MRPMTALLTLLLVPLALPALEITGETKVPQYRLVRLSAKDVPAGSALLWDVSDESLMDVQECGVQLLVVAPPGRYKVKLRALRLTKEGVTEIQTARAEITVEGVVPPVPPVPPPPAPGKLDPVKATGRLRFGSSGCTATVIGPRRADGRWDVLTASHCTGGVGARGMIALKDGRTLPVSVTVRETRADLTWLVTEDALLADLHYAHLAEADPAAGTAVWHEGYGIDRPENHEAGTITGGPDGNGQMQLRISVSSGDSGSGFFRTDTGALVAVVCCGSARDVWGGAVSVARRLRPTAAYAEPEWTPLPLPAHSATGMRAAQPCSSACICGCGTMSPCTCAR